MRHLAARTEKSHHHHKVLNDGQDKQVDPLLDKFKGIKNSPLMLPLRVTVKSLISLDHQQVFSTGLTSENILSTLATLAMDIGITISVLCGVLLIVFLIFNVYLNEKLTIDKTFNKLMRIWSIISCAKLLL